MAYDVEFIQPDEQQRESEEDSEGDVTVQAILVSESLLKHRQHTPNKADQPKTKKYGSQIRRKEFTKANVIHKWKTSNGGVRNEVLEWRVQEKTRKKLKKNQRRRRRG